jgi:hypothetical protein
VLGALLVLLLVEAVQRGLADLHAHHVRYYFEHWAKQRHPVRLDEWRDALGAAEARASLVPGSPDALEDLGVLYDWAAFAKPPRHALVLAYHDQALTYFRQAAQRRPTSGYTWANVAQQKLALDALDAEFARALELAALLGPWEPEVQLSVADAGLATWRHLPDAAREAVLATVVRASRREGEGLARIVQRRGKRAVCDLPNLREAAQALACR